MKKFHDGQFLEKYKSLKFTYVCKSISENQHRNYCKLISMYFSIEFIRAKFYQQWIPSNLYRGANFYANKHTLKVGRWQKSFIYEA